MVFLTEAWIGLAGFLIVLGLYSKIVTLEKQLKAVKFQLKRIMDGVDIPPHPVDDKVRSLLIQGKEIEAIKEVRIALGLSLVEAKQYVDNLKGE